MLWLANSPGTAESRKRWLYYSWWWSKGARFLWDGTHRRKLAWVPARGDHPESWYHPNWKINPWKLSGSQKQSARGEALYEATKLEAEMENPQKPAKAHRERKCLVQTSAMADLISRSQLWQQLVSRRGCGAEKRGRVAKVTATPSPLHASSAKAGARWGVGEGLIQ